MSEFPEYSHVESNEQFVADTPIDQRYSDKPRKVVTKAWKTFIKTGDDSFWFWDVPQDNKSKHSDSEMEL